MNNDAYEVKTLMNASLDSNLNLNKNSVQALYKSNSEPNLFYGTVWDFWQDRYYPAVIRESYPVYIKERSEDNGKKSFEIIKALQDKKLMKLDKVSDFIEAMDTLIKIL